MYLGLTALCQFTQNFFQNFPVCHFRFSDFFQEQQEGHHWGWEGFFVWIYLFHGILHFDLNLYSTLKTFLKNA